MLTNVMMPLVVKLLIRLFMISERVVRKKEPLISSDSKIDLIAFVTAWVDSWVLWVIFIHTWWKLSRCCLRSSSSWYYRFIKAQNEWMTTFSVSLSKWSCKWLHALCEDSHVVIIMIKSWWTELINIISALMSFFFHSSLSVPVVVKGWVTFSDITFHRLTYLNAMTQADFHSV